MKSSFVYVQARNGACDILGLNFTYSKTWKTGIKSWKTWRKHCENRDLAGYVEGCFDGLKMDPSTKERPFWAEPSNSSEFSPTTRRPDWSRRPSPGRGETSRTTFTCEARPRQLRCRLRVTLKSGRSISTKLRRDNRRMDTSLPRGEAASQ